MDMKNIEHVVLLMLENRSFDSMLGWLYEHQTPAKNVPALKAGERAYHGLQGLELDDYANADATGKIRIAPQRGAHGLAIPNINPGEDFDHVSTQLFGSAGADTQGPPTMRGFVRDYVAVLKAQNKTDAEIARLAGQVMQSYTPDQLPVLNGLAEHYAVCDLWFSSVPSQTNPNRAFALCGTSMGLVNNGFLEPFNPAAAFLEKTSGEAIGDDRFDTPTLFNALSDAGLTWKIFRQSGYLPRNFETVATLVEAALLLLPKNLYVDVTVGEVMAYLRSLSSQDVVSDYTHRLFPQILKIANADAHFGMLESFFALARSGQLPTFTYIEPEWTIAHQATGSSAFSFKTYLYHQGNDYHPPDNLDAGENLVKRVYESLISNRAAWEKTLLIITFDEPVGSFDHVPPPAAVPPWGTGKTPPFERQHDFNFDRLGGRVPTILVSPWIEKGTVFRSETATAYDHTSIISSVLHWRGLDKRVADFQERTKAAPTFNAILSLSTPRTDEREVRFLRLAHKVGDPVRYYDRFCLRNPVGQYVAHFKEHYVVSMGAVDPTATEYFPTLDYGNPVVFYLQNAGNRPDNAPIPGRGNVKVKLISTEDGLGSYNVLGKWADSRDCYYFNDYIEGDFDRKQTWLLVPAAPGDGPLHFGDRVFLANDGQRLTYNYSTMYGNYYLSTDAQGSWWTVEPLVEPTPDQPALQYGEEVHLKHNKTGAYITPFALNWSQWKPTLGQGAHVALKLALPYGTGIASGASARLVDGAPVALVSAHEALVYGGKRCDHLYSGNRTDLYYYYADYAPDNSTWHLSLANGSGELHSGSQVRIINKKTGQFLVPDNGYLTTVANADANCLWTLESTRPA